MKIDTSEIAQGATTMAVQGDQTNVFIIGMVIIVLAIIGAIVVFAFKGKESDTHNSSESHKFTQVKIDAVHKNTIEKLDQTQRDLFNESEKIKTSMIKIETDILEIFKELERQPKIHSKLDTLMSDIRRLEDAINAYFRSLR